MTQKPDAPRFFVQLKSHGVTDADGKTIMGIGVSSKKVVAEPDAPLALVVAVLETWQSGWHYSSTKAAERDVARLRNFCDQLHVSGPSKEVAA